MATRLLDSHLLAALTRDGRLLFATRMLRLFGYGLVSVVLFLYLLELGFGEFRSGLLLTLTLLGDTLISLGITTTADRVGRRKMLILGSLLMLGAGVVFVLTRNYIALLLAATIGVISPSGNEVGPFLAIEQAALSHLIPGEIRTGIFAWYNLAGSVATAVGSGTAGLLTRLFRDMGWTPLESYRAILLGYAAVGLALSLLFLLVSRAVELTGTPPPAAKLLLGLHRSRRTVLKLSALFSLDAFAGGLVAQSMVAYWFQSRFGTRVEVIGAIFFGANILAGISALTASRLAARFGLLNTMVFTHVPSNILLILVPLMPNLPLAIAVLLARFSISQMDVPTRQSYTMAVVDPDERSAAAGVTGVARTTGAALSPIVAGPLLAIPSLLSVPFYLCGGLKLIYDFSLWKSFKSAHIKDERQPAAKT